MLVFAFIGYRVQRDPFTILGKTSYIYTYKTYETPLRDSVHNSKKKNYTLTYLVRTGLHVFMYCDSYAM